MRRLVIRIITIFTLFFIVGCTVVDEPKIFVDQEIDVYI